MHFTDDYFDLKCIHLICKLTLNGTGHKMTQERAVYCIKSSELPLAGVFEKIFQRVTGASSSEPVRILVAFASSLLNSEAFNLARIEQLPEESDRRLCFDLFEYCMSEGLTEDERAQASAAFAPFVEAYTSGTRH